MNKIFIFLVFFMGAAADVSAELVTGTDELAQLPYWELRTDAMSFRLVQRLPDQTRAYFSGRGFSKEDTEYIASYCVFQTVFKNVSPEGRHTVIRYNAEDWRIMFGGKEQSLVLRESWRPIWQQRQAKQAQRIAFEWSLLPTKQQYKPADYNWGMTIFKLPHGAKFDLRMKWKNNEKEQTATIKNLQCSKDIYIPPAEQ